MTKSLEERWAELVARGGADLAALNDVILSAIARDCYLSAEQVESHIEAALNRLDKNDGGTPDE